MSLSSLTQIWAMCVYYTEWIWILIVVDTTVFKVREESHKPHSVSGPV